jgi:hypothetical protein
MLIRLSVDWVSFLSFWAPIRIVLHEITLAFGANSLIKIPARMRKDLHNIFMTIFR